MQCITADNSSSPFPKYSGAPKQGFSTSPLSAGRQTAIIDAVLKVSTRPRCFSEKQHR